MAKKNILGDVVKKSSNIVGTVACGVKRFVGNIVPKTMRQAISGKHRRSRKSRRSRKTRKN
jgi:hypothetical protein|uniref:Uncharacterized protein n=1 Tax=viral metagenome TaxID=1070528 RepID=A0A6C0JML7_9ZZZZ